MAADDTVSIDTGRAVVQGWTGVRIVRSIEQVPSLFRIDMTARYPGGLADVVYPGQPVTVRIGGDPVVTGRVDRVVPRIDKRSHTVAVIGRGKCADLVDCSAEWPGGRISNATLFALAMKLAKPYGIQVEGYDDGFVFPDFQLSQGETPWEIIERHARIRATLAYEMPDGSLRLNQASEKQAASGAYEGSNVESAVFERSIDGRYSEYAVYLTSIAPLTELSDLFGDVTAPVFVAEDDHLKRLGIHRRLSIVAEAGDAGQRITKDRAVWEANRRKGRSAACRVTVDSWRDKAGELWSVNTLVPAIVPSLGYPPEGMGLPSLVSVEFRLDERGTHADLLLMPKEAFLPQPMLAPWERGMGDIVPGSAL